MVDLLGWCGPGGASPQAAVLTIRPRGWPAPRLGLHRLLRRLRPGRPTTGLGAPDSPLRACGGTAATPYPYGPGYLAQSCNGSSGSAEPTGNRPVCASRWAPRPNVPDSGPIYDMSGNVEEWVRPPQGRPADRVAMGGSYLSSGDGAALSCAAEHDVGDSGAAPHRGFRCCRETR